MKLGSRSAQSILDKKATLQLPTGRILLLFETCWDPLQGLQRGHNLEQICTSHERAGYHTKYIKSTAITTKTIKNNV